MTRLGKEVESRLIFSVPVDESFANIVAEVNLKLLLQIVLETNFCLFVRIIIYLM